MYEVAVSVGAELLSAWLVTLILAAVLGFLLRDTLSGRAQRQRRRGSTKGGEGRE